MTEKTILYTLKGGEPVPQTIIPLYRTLQGAKLFSLKAEAWIIGFSIVPWPILDPENTDYQDNTILSRDEFINIQVGLGLWIKNDKNVWFFLREFPLVNRGTLHVPDLLSSYLSYFRYFGLQKNYAIGVSFRFPVRELENYEYITIRGDLEESVSPSEDVIDNSPVPVPAELPFALGGFPQELALSSSPLI